MKEEIKIRYAYLISPSNVKEDPSCYEVLRFRIFALSELEKRSIYFTIEERIMGGYEFYIRIVGRDRYLNRVDMDGNEIYEGDILRWYSDGAEYHDEEVDLRSHFSELDTERDCKVIGTVYDHLERYRSS